MTLVFVGRQLSSLPEKPLAEAGRPGPADFQDGASVRVISHFCKVTSNPRNSNVTESQDRSTKCSLSLSLLLSLSPNYYLPEVCPPLRYIRAWKLKLFCDAGVVFFP